MRTNAKVLNYFARLGPLEVKFDNGQALSLTVGNQNLETGVRLNRAKTVNKNAEKDFMRAALVGPITATAGF